MTLTGPQKYPGASRDHWYQDDYPGTPLEVNTGCLHTTEGTSLPYYDGGATAPNFTALPDIRAQRLDWHQHFDVDVSSRALANPSGGVETNTLNVVQVELVGTCNPAYRAMWGRRIAGTDYLYWPDAPDWALRELAKFVAWAHDKHGIPLRSAVRWAAYPGSYGTSNGVRLTGSQWLGYYGWLGHQHVPENLHGDPGNLDFAKVLRYATAPELPEDTVTEPAYTSLIQSLPAEVSPGVWSSLRWDTENSDPLGMHAPNAQTFLTGCQYNGSVQVVVDGLPVGARARLALTVDDEAGGLVERLSIADQPATSGADFTLSAPVVGRVASDRHIKIQILHDGPVPATVVGARFRGQAWDE